MQQIEDLARMAVDCGLRLHRALGPGLLESAYEACLHHDLTGRGLRVERQKTIPILYDGVRVDAGFRADLLVENTLLIELKSIERLAPVHTKQMLTYLRLLKLPLGLLMNFGAGTFKEGCRRIANDYYPEHG